MSSVISHGSGASLAGRLRAKHSSQTLFELGPLKTGNSDGLKTKQFFTNAVSVNEGHEANFDAEVAPKAVSFIDMFRFSTRQELLLDFIAILAAVGAGAAQVRP